MYLEYYINTIDEKDIEIKKNIEDLINNTSIRNVLATLHPAKLIKKNFPDIKVGTFIDYPISNQEPKQRQKLISDALSFDIDYIAITIPTYYLVNRKYEKIKDDIKQNLDLCKDKEIRYILEYRKFDHQLLAKACDVLLAGGINIIYPATGFFLDSLEDNILACTYLHKKTSIRTIINGNSWNTKQTQQILKSDMYGFSSNNIFSIKLLNKNYDQ
jgi:deoxyribose-phosphate aldolase